MTFRFLVTDSIPDSGLQMMRDAGEVTVLPTAPNPAELRALCASGDYDVLLSQLADTVDGELLAAAKLRGISNYAVGFNNIDVAVATAKGILVSNTPGVLTDPTADIALLLLLGTARRVVEADALVRSGGFEGWKPQLMIGSDVAGQVLGLAGFGRIARATARRALGFGMDVVFSPRPPAERMVSDEELGEFAGKVRQLAWQDVVAQADFLSLHVPLTEDTRHLVDASVLAAMKPGAILINTARGPVVDEAALVTALREGIIAGAGLDVFENEPALAPGLAELPNTVLLPHVGSATGPVRSKMAVLAAANAIAMAKGQLPPHPVNPEALPA
ncbi:D-glycerate dehydrogenase [Arthrobacter sp. BF1]|uniref:2-hydroxyacid dehydrogenase n=1 Tax=Arthrobacter sp. BF1 TaxID=2821145 RepID=UPI001C4F2278|nr:D-glycerate dehydrogenase [Arthrobacter sp. BF1]